MKQDVDVSGTLIWYYFICEREVWLIGRQIVADQDEGNVSLGRFIQEHSYPREKKELTLEHSKMDVFQAKDGELLVGEVKKTSRAYDSAFMQLAFYLSELKKKGISARGELRFPQEKKREEIVLDEELEEKLERVKEDIMRILYLPHPPQAQKKTYCKKCAYAEFCWA